MQTLELSETTPRTESRIKSLFWPNVTTAEDVDYLGVQGFWVCCIVALLSGVVMLLTGHAFIALSMITFFFLGGVGVREHSKFAATIVFLYYFLDTFGTGFGVVRILIIALFLSNLRATIIASSWRPDSEEAIAPPRLSETWGDKFSDHLPRILWPKIELFYRIFAVIIFGFGVVGLIATLNSEVVR
jgi:hypothetical protein